MKRLIIPASLALALVSATSPAGADHSWGGHHWSRTSSGPVMLTVVDSMTTSSTTDWDAMLPVVLADWDASADIAFAPLQAGDSSSKARKRCQAIAGKIRACNQSYGRNGWLGIAQIWLSGGHIVQAVVKVNDSYFDHPSYNDANAKRHVLCQEIGHDWGLDHQYTEPSCMDDRNGLFDPAFVSPGAHDFDQLASIYAHAHTSSSTQARAKGGKGHGGVDHHRTVSRQGRYTVVTFVVHAH